MAEKHLIDTGPSGPRSLHRIRTWLRCKRLYAATFMVPADPTAPDGRLVYRGFNPDAGTAQPLVRGSWLHVGAAHFWARLACRQQGLDPEAYWSPLAAVDAVREAKRGTWGSFADTEYEAARSAVAAYCAHWEAQVSGANEGRYRVLSVERALMIAAETPKHGTWTFHQKPDYIVEDTTLGRVLIRDVKTHRGFDLSGALHVYSPDLQMLAYAWWGSGTWGDRFGGVEIDGISYPAPHVLKIQRPDPAPGLVSLFPLIYTRAEKEIAGAEAAGWAWEDYEAAANEQVCTSKYGRCGHWDACLWGKFPVAGDSVHLERLKIVAEPFPSR